MKGLRRYRYPLIGFTLLVSLGAGWTILQSFPTPPSRINLANFAKIKKGMTQEDVHAILGRPGITCGSIRSNAPHFVFKFNPQEDHPIPGERQDDEAWFSSFDELPPWVPNRITIRVYFGYEGLVEKADLIIEKRSLKERFARFIPD
jgi:outer membrane protein assembly factor BamE (lipoprotein component of BamABCDE complex)